MVGGFNHLEKYEFVNGKDYPIYYGKNMFETTNQIFIYTVNAQRCADAQKFDQTFCYTVL